MNSFSQYPFVRILIPFLAGILAEIYLDLPDTFVLFLFIFFFIFYVTDFLTVNIFSRYSLRVLNGVYLFVLLFLAGSYWTSAFDDRKKENHYTNQNDKEKLYRVEILRDPVVREKSVKAEVRILYAMDSSEMVPVSGKTVLYLERNKEAENLKYGDELLVCTKWKEIPPPQNPGEFDYRQYCAFHRIYAQGYANHFSWEKSGEGGSSVFRFASESRKKLLKILKDAGLEDQEFAVASALILGYVDEIDQETKTAYSSSGALHVLSVSGLHVAIIFAVFDKLLLFLHRFKNGRYYKAILILLVLWLYALLTGLSPSVIRSAAMLSFVVIGKLINRNASIFNIFSASAFVLLLFDPLMIMEVGFQLSYLAVLGIVYLHPKIYGWFFIRNRFLDFVWNVTAVSIAAQIATFPLGLYYFHQFPNYFLLSNLVVIPLGTIILYNGILALVFSFIPGLNEFLIFALKWSVKILNESVYWMEELPYSLSSGIHTTVFETWIIYGIIVSMLIYFAGKKVFFLKASLMAVSVLFVLFTFKNLERNNQVMMVIYHVKNHSAVDFIDGRSHVFITDPDLISDERKLSFHIKNHWDICGLDDKNSGKNMLQYKNYLALRNIRVVTIDSAFRSFVPEKKMEMDVVIIKNNPRIKLNEIRNMFRFKTLVIDSSNKNYRIRNWKKEILIGENVFIVPEEGAFIKKI